VTAVVPALADPEIAATVFEAHLTAGMNGSLASRYGWSATQLSPLSAVVNLTAVTITGERHPYYIVLGADYYDLYPPQAAFVIPPLEPADAAEAGNFAWTPAREQSRWLPTVDPAKLNNELQIHASYPYETEGNQQRQLICSSMNFDYYITNHVPTETQKWRQGRHTLVALLSRLSDALTGDAYLGPAGALDT
jgi:hypothetical protein